MIRLFSSIFLVVKIILIVFWQYERRFSRKVILPVFSITMLGMIYMVGSPIASFEGVRIRLSCIWMECQTAVCKYMAISSIIC